MPDGSTGGRAPQGDARAFGKGEAHRARVIVEAAVLDDQGKRDVAFGDLSLGLGVAVVMLGAGRREQGHMLGPGNVLPAIVDAHLPAKGQHDGCRVVPMRTLRLPGRTAFSVSVIEGRQVPSFSVRSVAMNSARPGVSGVMAARRACAARGRWLATIVRGLDRRAVAGLGTDPSNARIGSSVVPTTRRLHRPPKRTRHPRQREHVARAPLSRSASAPQLPLPRSTAHISPLAAKLHARVSPARTRA